MSNRQSGRTREQLRDAVSFARQGKRVFYAVPAAPTYYCDLLQNVCRTEGIGFKRDGRKFTFGCYGSLEIVTTLPDDAGARWISVVDHAMQGGFG